MEIQITFTGVVHQGNSDGDKTLCGRSAQGAVATGEAVSGSPCKRCEKIKAGPSAAPKVVRPRVRHLAKGDQADDGTVRTMCGRELVNDGTGEECKRCRSLVDKATAPKADKPQPKRHLAREDGQTALCGRGSVDGTGEECKRCRTIKATLVSIKATLVARSGQQEGE